MHRIMPPLACLTLFICLAGQGVADTEAQCAESLDQNSLLQIAGRVADEISQQAATEAEATIQATQAAQLQELGKVEQTLRSLTDTAEELKAARSYAATATRLQSQTAETLDLAFKEAEQAEAIQNARAYEESNVTEILHEVVQELQQAPGGRANAALLDALHRAENAQAAMIEDTFHQDSALAGLRQTIGVADRSAISGKLVDQTQTTRTLDDAIARLHGIQATQLDHAKQSVHLSKSIAGLGKAKHTMSLLEESGQKQQAQELNDMQTKLATAQSHSKELEAELTMLMEKRDSEHETLLSMQKRQQVDGTVLQQAKNEHRKAILARSQASAIYQAATSSQAALETQAAKTAQSLMMVAQEAAASANQLQSALVVGTTPTTVQ